MNPAPYTRVVRHTARGHPYEVWERPLPRIIDDTLNCVAYLYRSRHEAEEAINIGGSGFLISVPCETLPPPAGFVYAVTNKHVIDAGGVAIRVNLRNGGFDVIETKRADWILAQDDDLAICVVHGFGSGRYQVKTVPRDMCMKRADIEAENIGPGDEIILVGRFINHEGKERNMPTVRFGHISQMPIEPIEYEGQQQESFLCEVKSIGGFSGSPVFLAPITGFGRPENSKLKKHAMLLGVDWAHLQNVESAVDERGHKIPHIRFPTNTGMMAVVPSWKLDALLDHPRALEERKMEEERETNRRGAPKVARDVNEPPSPLANAESPTHREDFMRLVSAAAQKREQED
jgi:hypothetical protein